MFDIAYFDQIVFDGKVWVLIIRALRKGDFTRGFDLVKKHFVRGFSKDKKDFAGG